MFIKMEKETRVIEWLENFSVKNCNDVPSITAYELCKNFSNSKENVKKYWEAFSDFYYISYLVPYEEMDESEDDIELWWDEEQWMDNIDQWLNSEERRKYRAEQRKKGIEKRKEIPGIYNILEKCSYDMVEGHPIEILIWKYSEESMERLRKITEEKRKEFEWIGFSIWEPKSYVYFIGFSWWTLWRTNQEIIREIREMFPNKVKVIKAE